MHDVVAELEVGIKEIAAEDRAGWSATARSDRLRDLLGLRAGFEIEVVRALADWDQVSSWADDGALSPTAWLCHQFPLSRPEAANLVRVARLSAHHPVVAD